MAAGEGERGDGWRRRERKGEGRRGEEEEEDSGEGRKRGRRGKWESRHNEVEEGRGTGPPSMLMIYHALHPCLGGCGYDFMSCGITF